MANCLGAPWDLKPFTDDVGVHYDLGDYIGCALKDVVSSAQIIFVALALIIVMRLIYKTVMNRENSTVMEEVMKEWPYVLLLAIIAIGGAGSILDIILKFLGLGGVGTWLDGLNQFLDIL